MTPIQRITAERKREVEVEGWSAAHDDEHADGEMMRAATLYYQHATGTPLTLRVTDGAPIGWPWDAKWWKPKTPERDLERAGALCLAEQERLRRIPGSYRGHVQQKLGRIVEAMNSLAASPSLASNKLGGE